MQQFKALDAHSEGGVERALSRHSCGGPQVGTRSAGAAGMMLCGKAPRHGAEVLAGVLQLFLLGPALEIFQAVVIPPQK